MNPSELRELADAVAGCGYDEATPGFRAAAYLREQAERMERAEPVAYRVRFNVTFNGRTVTDSLLVRDKESIANQVRAELITAVEPLYAMLAAPAPQSVPEGHWLAPMEPMEEWQGPSYLPNVDWPTRKAIYRAMRDAEIAAQIEAKQRAWLSSNPAAPAEGAGPNWQPVPPRACIQPTHEAADAFWHYWRENGETHKHGYYESTWGAINAALACGWSAPAEGAKEPWTTKMPLADDCRGECQQAVDYGVWPEHSCSPKCVRLSSAPAAPVPADAVEALRKALSAMRLKQRVTMWENDGDSAQFNAAVRGIEAALAAADQQEPK